MEFSEYRNELYQKWHKRLLGICWTLAAITFLTEIVVFHIFSHTGEDRFSPQEYIPMRILLPAAINVLALVAYTRMFSSRKATMAAKNWMACLTLLVICCVAAVFHNYFTMLLVLPSVPVFLSALFAERKLINCIALGALAGVALALVFWVRDYSGDRSIGSICVNVALCVAFLASSYQFALLIMKVQTDQIDFVYNAYTQEQSLIQELRIEPLTKLYNRTALEECINLYIQKYLEGEFVPHLVLMDVDHFKHINDRYGHNEGDIVLTTLAGIIREKMGGSRRAFRFGGDEIVLLFGCENLEQIRAIVEEIRDEFKGTEWSFKPDKPITLSIGISEYYKGLSNKDWFELTDGVMYKSKEGGRDSVNIA